MGWVGLPHLFVSVPVPVCVPDFFQKKDSRINRIDETSAGFTG
jgi:hypothetical protein